jgi:hypothetical protein
MIRWVAFIFVLLAVFYPLLPVFRRLWVGRLPGDFCFRFKSLEFCLPFGSALLWSLLAFLAATLTKLI